MDWSLARHGFRVGLLVLSVVVFSSKECFVLGEDSNVDESWPMQSVGDFLRKGSKVQNEHYLAFIKGCYQAAGGNTELCDRNERQRITMNCNQPREMTNFTTLGYAKVSIPPAAFDILSRLWNSHAAISGDTSQEQESVDNDKTNQLAVATTKDFPISGPLLRREQWSLGSVYTNYWASPTDMMDATRFLSSSELRKVEWQVKQVLEQWSGVSLVPTSTYGIRVYGHGSILAPHVDRLPLVISAILHIDHDSSEDLQPWPLQVVGHDGVAVNITLQPGEMILYEGHSVIHGRPYPFQGHFYANLFVHFEPIGYTFHLEQQIKQRQLRDSNNGRDLSSLFQYLLEKQDKIPKQVHYPPALAPSAQQESDIHLPPYELKDKTEQERWRQDYLFVRQATLKEPKIKRIPGVTSGHILAATGQLEALKQAAEGNPSLLHQADANGWKPIHEAARGGHVKVLEYLISQGADVNERTNEGLGASPLWWALQYFPDRHPVVLLLRRNGAVALAPAR